MTLLTRSKAGDNTLVFASESVYYVLLLKPDVAVK